jgi:hypothetical protein
LKRDYVLRAKTGVITLVILALITVVACFARRKITSWVTYASVDWLLTA